jgi:valyl-tRNA synthetase
MIKPVLQNKESHEAKLTRQTLVESFQTLLRLLHPLMPFISEEIWQALPHEGESLTIQPYPSSVPEWDAKEIEAEFVILEQFVTTVRTGRTLLNYQPGKKVTLYGAAVRGEHFTSLKNLHSYIEHLSRGTVKLTAIEAWPTDNVLRLVTEGISAGLVVEGEVDLESVLQKIQKQQKENHQETKRLEAKLGNVEFTSKAPAEVIHEHRDRVRILEQEGRLLTSSEQQLREMMQSRKP